MSSTRLQASSGLKRPTWHSIDWAGCYRQVRSLQRRIVQAVQRGAWRKVKRLSYLRIGRWRKYQPQPLKRIVIPKKNGKQRRLSIPTMEDRARQAVYLQALQPIAETQADPNS